MKYRITVLPGDGIGPEVIEQTLPLLSAIGTAHGHSFDFVSMPIGGTAIDQSGLPLPPETLAACRESDAVLLGAVGGPRWDTLAGNLRPEAGLLGLRAGLGVYANLRPALMFSCLASACPLRAELVSKGLDLLIIRELTGGIYFGERGRSQDGQSAWDTERYSVMEIRRLLQHGFLAARARKKRLCVVDKANVLESSRLWRETAITMGTEYPDISLSFMYVDNCAMQLVRNPAQFDVIATSNLFGDILSDEASMLTGSIGMLASASLGDSGPGLFEPIHGSAPDIAGSGKANPLATILSAAMLLRHGLKLEAEAQAIESAVQKVLDQGWRCADIASDCKPEKILTTQEMGKAVLTALQTAGSGGSA
ncbi:MAG: 3-isopropylmalate dehydrogenase [Spirochaetes bacterium]|nr:3-isopropylmalate dehydrogenase [Spirochaetota bacterium]